MTQARNISLSRFSQLANIPKTSIYRRCTELGIDTSSGLSPDAVELLKADFGLVQDEPEPEPPTVAPTEIVPSDFIQPGQLATVEAHDISLPDSFDASAMVRFFDGVTGQATDTTKLVAIADLALNAVNSAMDQKVQQQRAQLTQAEQDAQALAEKIAAAKTDLKVKALESRILAERQTAATQTAESLFTDLMALGKPAPDSQP
ncbi:hypothetical protein [Thermoleptolyngbya sp. M55_K2018_002]|uniref:hypothetical protein n=1 Tax=Thermoleptolyngbya sp. M55_K2018_002 TaxID=2747808 RepID=UPI0019F583A3|nr:hypothetical protein [Thermoleptolyngbya sp. M55_K2018_002]HIK39767.1 hypothetical protein [Thermoleptolyngbya sp. M55_K2018_002]